MTPSLQSTIVEYLETRGWYWDEENFIDVWDRPSDEKDKRQVHCWTLPQWEEYWAEPFGKPKSRRHENLKDAIWSQLLREEEPETYGCFFGDDRIE